MKRQTGFTLIELLVVISIIMILAGLTFSLFGYGNKKAATERARAEIAALSLAIESYKVEYGDYPRDEATDKLDARSSGNAAVTANVYNASSLVLYKALSGDTDGDGKVNTDPDTNEKNRVFFEFKANMLYPKAAGEATRPTDKPVSALVDPFRNVYGYSTIGSKASTSGSSNSSTEGYNPTFDLWSTATTEENKTTTDDVTWIKNW